MRVSYATIKKGCGHISRVAAIAGFIAALVGAPALTGAILAAISLYSDIVGQVMNGSPRHGIRVILRRYTRWVNNVPVKEWALSSCGRY